MMVRKIGRLFIFLSLFLSICADDFNLILKAIDAENTPVTEVGLGVPFLMNLTIESAKNFNNVQQVPTIDKLANGTIKDVGNSTTIKTINGRTTIAKTYQYEVRIDKEGFYHLGPAKIQISGQEYKSNILKLNVLNELNNKKNIAQSSILKLSIDKQKLYLGERAQLTIRFYYDSENIRLLSIEDPDLKDFAHDPFELTSSGTHEVGNKDYFYQEFIANIYPKKTGELLIPAVGAYYEEVKNNLNLFMSFFNQAQRKHINSQALKINVKSLPKTSEKIDVVGKFNSFNASVNQNVAVQGEGIVFKLELTGQGNFNNINLTQLKLPDEFNYYDSTHNITKLDNDLEVKTFEFILQSNKSGEFEIPAQQLNYFDTESEKYKQLFTKPISVQIMPLQEQLVVEQKEEDILSPVQDKAKPVVNIYEPIQKQKIIGFKLFLFLLILPAFICFLVNVKNYFLKNYKPDPLKRLQKKLNQSNNPHKLYQGFIEYFAAKFNVKEALITQEFIQEKFRTYNMPYDLINKWNVFFIKLNELSYGPVQEDRDLIEEAKIWVIIFNEKLKP
ncbi:MAG: BatD family protein [Candidatus Babeliales bacterium]|nr:BatD family protein [Candidatus Babeliales bacterium]